jgi:hypothetical protein
MDGRSLHRVPQNCWSGGGVQEGRRRPAWIDCAPSVAERVAGQSLCILSHELRPGTLSLAFRNFRFLGVVLTLES